LNADRQFAGQRQHNEFGCLRTDTGDLAERGIVFKRYGLHYLARVHGAQHTKCRLGTNPRHAPERVEHRELVGVPEPEQAQIVLPDDQCGAQGCLAAQSEGERVLGSDLHGKAHSPDFDNDLVSGNGQNSATHRGNHVPSLRATADFSAARHACCAGVSADVPATATEMPARQA
jgi:hypothetical protein